jgi:hypothetical protein
VAEVQHAVAKRKPILITGGRGVGKTFVLSRIDVGSRALRVALRDVAMDAGLVTTLITHPGALVVDDIDEGLTRDAFALLEHLAHHHPHPVVMTSTLAPDVKLLHECGGFQGLSWNAEVLQFWSDVTAHLLQFRVDPWERGWQTIMASTVAKAVGVDQIDKTVLGWCTVLLDLTYGHPTLLDAALEDVWRSGVAEVRSMSEWRHRYARIEEHLLSTGVRRLRKSFAWLERLDADAGSALRKVAADRASAADLTLEQRRVLLDTAFMCRTSTHEVVVAGEAFRRLLGGSPSGAPKFITIVETASGGDIIVRVAHTTAVVNLRGAAWKLVDALRSASRPLSLDDLEEKTEVDVGALRSALQRLRKELHDQGVDNVIENEWGEGYTLGTFPTLTAYTFVEPGRARLSAGPRRSERGKTR